MATRTLLADPDLEASWVDGRALRSSSRTSPPSSPRRSPRCAAREETFGVAPLFRFRDEAEAVQLANDTEFGLAAYLHTRDLGAPSAASSSPASAARARTPASTSSWRRSTC